jgi:hypothetical protein
LNAFWSSLRVCQIQIGYTDISVVSWCLDYKVT